MKHNVQEDDSGVHEVSIKAAYRDKFDGVTRCLMHFCYRNYGWTGKSRFITADDGEWSFMSITEAPVTCLGCIGADPWL
jgi:hypothetical protein